MASQDEDDCKITAKLEQIHDWAHICLKQLRPDDLHAAHTLGLKILNMLNEECLGHGIQFIALFEALGVGTDMLNKELQDMMHPRCVN